MHADPLPSDADPVAEQAGRFAEAHGVAATSLDGTWKALAEQGLAHPGLAFAAWTEVLALGGLLAPILVNCPDVGALLQDLQRFHPLLAREEIVVTRRGSSVLVSLRSPGGGAAHADTVDACFALLCQVISRLAGARAAPSLVTLRRPVPPDGPDAYESVFGRTEFGRAEDSCRFDEAALGVPLLQADPLVRSMLHPYAERRIAHRQAPWSTAVTELLADGRDTLSEVARALSVSSRTLQSRLDDEGVAFSALVDAVRRERAFVLLTQPELPVTVIATRLGFATPSAFTRAFRRWTGMPPSQYRREAHAMTR